MNSPLAEVRHTPASAAMRHMGLAIDYDGTIARADRVDALTERALGRARASGRKLILVTGRELDELLGIFPGIAVFDLVVAENGALLYCPATRERRVLAPTPPASLVSELVRRGVEPLSVGRSIVATVEPYESVALEVIRDLGLELHVVFNKGAVMILPTSVNKASGLLHALAELGLSPRNVVAVGDAENDHSMLELAEHSAAVANAIPALKDTADWVLSAEAGSGVIELIDALLEDDLRSRAARAPRRRLLIGSRADGAELRISPSGANLLLVGPAGAARAEVAAGLIAAVATLGYQTCCIDPQGKHPGLGASVAFGDTRQEPNPNDILAALEKSDAQIVVNLTGVLPPALPAFLQTLLARLKDLRVQTGRPHWLLLDDADLLPLDGAALGASAASVILAAAEPARIDPAALADVELVLALGEDAQAALARCAAALGADAAPSADGAALAPGEVLAWVRHEAAAARLRLAPDPTRADGELPAAAQPPVSAPGVTVTRGLR